MVALLRPGVDPGLPVAERASYVATHAGAWRLGWLPWQLAALGNFWVSIAFWRSAAEAGSRRAATWALGWFVIAAVPEQWAEAMLVTSFVDAATSDVATWARDWSLYAGLTGVWANLAYTVMVGCWMQCARQLYGRAVVPRSLELGLLGAFVLSGVLTLCSVVTDTSQALWFRAASAVNGVAFPALILWSLVLWRRIGHAGDTPD